MNKKLFRIFYRLSSGLVVRDCVVMYLISGITVVVE